MNTMLSIAAVLAAVVAAPSGSVVQPEPAAPPPQPALREVFPGVRADVAARVVEFDGEVPIDCHDAKTPLVYLEVMVCTPDTKEHETLVVTKARPSDIHAALLACGFEPGKPGSWTWNREEEKLESHAPTGAGLEVRIAYVDETGARRESRASEWVTADEGDRTFEPKDPAADAWWVFAGSRVAQRGGREVYDADGTGTVVGLTTFGTEVIAWRDVISHESGVQEPEWVANPKSVPKIGTKVTVRIMAVQPSGDPPRKP